jgi:hypothetical protein
LDNFGVVRDGILAVIDTTTDTLIDVDLGTPETEGIILTGRNPIYMDYDGALGRIVVSEVGSYFDQTDGGIETVDPWTFTAEGFIISENDLGSDVGDVVIVDGVKGYVVVGGFNPNGVAIFDVTTGVKTGDLITNLSFIPGLTLDSSKRLLVPDRTLTNPGIRIYDTFTDQEITTDPIDVGLPPFGAVIVPPLPPTSFVPTTDFTTGSYSTINLRDLTADVDLPSQVGIIESDSLAVYYNNKVYVINRFGFDNITVLDTADLSTAVAQFSTGNGTNPQDMAFVSDTKAYVSLYGANDLLIVDPTAPPGAEITGTIDLSGFLDGDADGFVEASPMVIVGTTLFVALQRLDNFAVVRDGILAVIDTTTDTLIDVDLGTPGTQGIVLTGRNPIYMDYDGALGRIVVSEVGNYFDQTDGGIETVDPWTFVAEGLIISENDLGSDVGDVVIVDGLKGYVVVGGFDPNGVAIFDVATGAKTGDLITNLSFIPGLTLDSSKRLLVPDRALTNPGIRIYDTFTDQEITTDPIDVGLPPFGAVNLF